uniref:EFR3-like protein n=1 Tax=Globodera rostochiensis TaxID=31243 RepID=A0A914I6P1_GLORO
MSHLCLPSNCCASCKQRYKRLVDSIYPRQPPFDAPLGANMQKLTFYSISHPEKLNRIGIYFIQRLTRDLTRQRFAEVKVTVDAMERLLKSCHGSPSLNQFIEGYLLMVQRLLETNNAHMEKLATDLFVRFSGIEEDSPSYHRQYDFFISKFSSMCHAQNGAYIRSQRFNGLRGLRGVIWKSASDDLQANIWEKQHMNKIVPSILFNFQHDDENDDLEDQGVDQSTGMLYNHYPDEPGSEGSEPEPRNLALQCLRELFQKCSFGSLKSVLEPVFIHFELHHKWDPPATFAIKTFKAILYSIQSQNSYFVIQELINQLELQPTTEPEVRVGMATVLARIVSIAGTSIGPLLLAIFNSLLKQLRSSVEFQQSRQCTDHETERLFQDTLINALGDFASALPDYQKVEIMMFTAASIPTITESNNSASTGATAAGEQIKWVATKYKTLYLATVFTDAFLKTLLQLQLTTDPEVRLIAQRIFHTLLDRHENQARLEHIQFVADLDIELQLSVEKCSRQDQLFMRRHIHAITSTLYRNVVQAVYGQQPSGPVGGASLDDQLDAVLCSIALLCTELMALENGNQMSAEKLANVHNLVAKFMNLFSCLLAIPALCQHVQQVIKAREKRAHPSLNIVDNAQKVAADVAEKLALQAYSPPAGRAPIAHMDSEDNELSNGETLTCRTIDGTALSSREKISTDRVGIVDLGAEPSMLFSSEIIFEAIQASNKCAQRLLQPFKPLALAQTLSATGSNVYLQNGSKLGGAAGFPNNSIISAFTPSAAGASSSTTSGGLMFSSPLNSSRSAQENDSNSSNTQLAEDGEKLNGAYRTSSVDAASVGSSSVDWSPPESRKHSRRNTALGGGGVQQAVALPITVEQLRIFANSPIDVAEEERLDQEKSRKVLQLYRGKTVKQLEEFLIYFVNQSFNFSFFVGGVGGGCCNCAKETHADQHHHQCCTTKTAPEGAETLAQTLHRLTQRHEEKCKVREFGQQGAAATIFDIKFPASFEM